MPVRMDSKEQGSAIVRECVKTLKVQSLCMHIASCILNFVYQSEAFQKKERGEAIPDVTFNVSDKALRIQEAKSKVKLPGYVQVCYTLTCCRTFFIFTPFITSLTARMRKVKVTTYLPTLLESPVQKLRHVTSWKLIT